MEKEKINKKELLKWLDMQISAIKNYQFNEYIRNIGICYPIKTICPFEMHVKDARIIANVLDVKVKEDINLEEEFPYRYSFMYEGVRIFSIHETQE